MTSHTSAGASPSFNVAALWFEAFACTASLMGFLAIIGPIARLLHLAPWQIGLAITSAGIAWMILARVWGSAGDRYGRRRVMLVGLAGFVVSYALLCFFIAAALRVSMPAAIVFCGILAGRTLAGAFYAAIPASSVALISEHYPAAGRTSAIGGISAANGAGMLAGPAAAGFLATIGLHFALLLIAILPALSFIVIWRTLPPDRPSGASQQSALRISDTRLRQALLIALAATFSVAIAQVSVGFYALDRLGLAPADAARTAGIAFAAVGAALIGAQALVTRLQWAEGELIRRGLLVSALGFGLAIFANEAKLLWAAYFVGAAGMGLVFPAFFSLGANAVRPNDQGAAAGLISSVQGLGAILGPIAGTLIYQMDVRAPYALIATLLIVTAFLFRDGGPPARSGT